MAFAGCILPDCSGVRLGGLCGMPSVGEDGVGKTDWRGIAAGSAFSFYHMHPYVVIVRASGAGVGLFQCAVYLRRFGGVHFAAAGVGGDAGGGVDIQVGLNEGVAD
jgi:hypothetical protein